MTGTLLPSASGSPNRSKAPAATWAQRFKGLLLIFTTRLVRGGPRFLIQIAACVFVLFVFVSLMPARLSDGYESILDWSHPMPREARDLRVVAFGSQDLAGSAVPTNKKSERVPWTKVLCQELGCTSYTSLVPPSDGGPGLTSNLIYDGQINAVINSAKDKDIAQTPAYDFEYLREQYPTSNQVADLDAQLRDFLTRPLPRKVPRQTLFIFTFGTWDIWNLAALARKNGEQAVDALVSHIVGRIEWLYLKSLNPKSLAFSDFWSNCTREEILRLTSPDAPKRVDERKLESFRVLVPKLFDITLSPAWHARPAPPFPHSQAEQMRNAAYLTERWNSRMGEELKKWKERAGSKPEGAEAETLEDVAMEVPSMTSLLKYLPPALQPESAKKQSIEEVIVAPYPRRVAFESDPGSAIMDAMTEEELQRSGLQDSKGRGSASVNATMRFLDVWTACLPGEMQLTGAEPMIDEECESPGDHLFYDSYTISQRAVDHIAGDTARATLQKMFPPKSRKGWIN